MHTIRTWSTHSKNVLPAYVSWIVHTNVVEPLALVSSVRPYTERKHSRRKKGKKVRFDISTEAEVEAMQELRGGS